jgi:hypothetical protein
MEADREMRAQELAGHRCVSDDAASCFSGQAINVIRRALRA